MRPDTDTIRLALLTVLLALFSSGFAHAQQEPAPAVQVDMSVLDPGKPPVYAAPSPAAQPVRRAARPSLIGPDPTPAPQQQAAQPPAALTQQMPEKPVEQKAVMFPIKVKDSSDQYDPSLEKSNATTAPAPEPVKQAINPPLPPLKPVAIAFKKPEKKKIQAQYIGDAEKQEKTVRVSPGMAMPAVPNQVVQSERLVAPKSPSPGVNDALTEQLSVPDKMAMVRSIEAITAKAAALTPEKKSQPETHRIVAPAPSRKPGEKTVQTKAVQKPASARLAKIAPAAGAATGKLPDITEPFNPVVPASIPRSPPEETHEQAYVTLPFASGAAQLDKKTTKTLKDNVVPLLRNNQEWRVQIQAFAGKTKDDFKDSRRLSLSRALAVRTYLMESGIEARRMDVRALGAQTDRKPLDRVDFVFFDPARMD